MGAQDTTNTEVAIPLTESSAAAAFAALETDFREHPETFYTPEEAARMEVADLSTARAIHFMALLRQGGAA